MSRNLGATRRNFNYDEILEALNNNNHDLTKSARELTKLGKGKVSRQLLRYWVNTEDFDDVNAPHFEADQLTAKVRAQDTNRKLRREIKNLSEVVRTQEEWEANIKESIGDIIFEPYEYKFNHNKEGVRLTAEILISDLQIGKLTTNYNTQVAINRIKELGYRAVQAIRQKVESGYVIERIVVAFLGDLIESDEKHFDSARGCDSSTAEQMADCIKYLYEYILVPLSFESEKMDCVGICGNHDHNENGLRAFKAGLTQLSYPIYKALELLCTQTIPHATWAIPEGVFHVDEIYGSKVLYEHGVGVAVNEEAMRKRKFARGEQTESHIFYCRLADKHNVCTFNNAQYVVNGAFFGGGKTGSEYSEQAGYHSQAGQWMGFHTRRHLDDGRTTLFDQFVIQLGHIGEGNE